MSACVRRLTQFWPHSPIRASCQAIPSRPRGLDLIILYANGTTRVRFDRGWTSVSVKNGNALLELMLPTSLSQEVERELTRRAAEFGIVVQEVVISVRTFCKGRSELSEQAVPLCPPAKRPLEVECEEEEQQQQQRDRRKPNKKAAKKHTQTPPP